MCQNSSYIKLWLYDEIISGQMPLWKVPKDIYFFQFFSLIQHIYCSIDNTYSSKICIHIKPRTSNLCTCVLSYDSLPESQCNGIFNQSKSILPFKISELFVIIDRSKNKSHCLSGILTYKSTQVRSSLLYSAHMRYTHLVSVCTAASYQTTPSGPWYYYVL